MCIYMCVCVSVRQLGIGNMYARIYVCVGRMYVYLSMYVCAFMYVYLYDDGG